MPKVCLHFRDLETRIQALTAKFVVDQLAAEAADPMTHVPDLDRLAAFRLLAHAEVEEFLEAKAKEGLVALTASISVSAGKVSTFPEVFVLAYALGKQFTVSWPFDPAKFLTEVHETVRAAEKAIAENNGVKGTSYFLLSLMAGKYPDEIDPSLGASLTSYGKSRGDVAHHSVARVRTFLAPSAEAKAINDLAKALASYFGVSST